MIDLLLQIGVSNLCVSGALAVAAWLAQSIGKRPLIAHVLWLLVLVKLVTPPLVNVPVAGIPSFSASSAEAAPPRPRPSPDAIVSASVDPDASLEASAVAVDLASSDTVLATILSSWSVAPGKNGLALLWFLGSVCVLAWSLGRVVRFHRLLGLATGVAPPEVQTIATEIAGRLGLGAAPTISTTTAQLSPIVWWVGGRVRIVVPADLAREMDTGQLRWVLAHELAHVRRRDHLVRWLEWLACVGFWWNPVAWWARRQLRANEEVCCDALVLSRLKPDPHKYASSLLTVIEFLASPVIRPPAMASEITGGGFLERRFKMIVSTDGVRNTPRWLYASLVILALALVPLGVGAQDDKKDAGIEAHFAKLGIGTEQVARIGAVLERSGLSDDQVEQALGGMLKIIFEIQSEGEDFELDPRLEAYLVGEAGLTGAQLERVVRISQRVAASVKDLRGPKKKPGAGIEGHFERVQAFLVEKGFSDDQIEFALGRMKKLVPVIQKKGKDFELDSKMKAYLAGEGELSDEQIELVVGISQRIAGSLNEKKNQGAGVATYFPRIQPVLEENGLSEEQIEQVFSALGKLVSLMQSKGEDFELDDAWEDFFIDEVGLMDDQIELVLGVSQRLAFAENRKKAAAGIEQVFPRIQPLLEEDGFSEEQIEQVFGVLERIVPAILAKGEEFEASPRLESYLSDEVGLTAEQVDLVLGLAQRIAAGLNERKKQGGIEGHFEKVQAKLEKSGFSEAQIKGALRALQRLVPAMQAKGADFEPEARMDAYLVDRLGLTDEQIELVLEIARGIAQNLEKEHEKSAELEEHYEKLGIDEKGIHRLRKALTERGLGGEQVRQVLRALIRVVREVKSEGEEFELDPRMKIYFEGEVVLTEEQIELVVGIAKRIARASSEVRRRRF